ncbi:SDR family oxidoreductase, partial [Acidobacteriota bacterium]
QAGEAVIVNVISIAGKNAFAGSGGYGATKHALLGFTRSLMFEERRNGIRVLALCPGSVETEFFDNPLTRHIAPVPGSALQPEDIADTVLHMIRLPQRATISEIDIRPSDPTPRT